MLLQIFAVGENSCTLNRNIDSQLLPRKLRGIFNAIDGIFPAIHYQTVFRATHGFLIASIHRVIFEQVRKIISGDDIVEANDFKPRRIEHDLKDCPTNAAKSINGYFCHNSSPAFSQVSTSHLKNVILSEAKKLYHQKYETLTALRTAQVSVTANAPSE